MPIGDAERVNLGSAKRFEGFGADVVIALSTCASLGLIGLQRVKIRFAIAITNQTTRLMGIDAAVILSN